MADDGYVSWYQGKLWQLLPAIYRTAGRAGAGRARAAAGAAQPHRRADRHDPAQHRPAVGEPVDRDLRRLGRSPISAICWRRGWCPASTRARSAWTSPRRSITAAAPARSACWRNWSPTSPGATRARSSSSAGSDARAISSTRRSAMPLRPTSRPGHRTRPMRPGTIVSNGAQRLCLRRRRHLGGRLAGPSGGRSGDRGRRRHLELLRAARLARARGDRGAGRARIRARPAGGFADLRNAYADRQHRCRVRRVRPLPPICARARNRPAGTISPTSACSSGGCRAFRCWPRRRSGNGTAATPCFTFDPSGRQIQLFAPSSRTAASFGDDWVSPDEWQLPVAVREVLWSAYPGSALSGGVLGRARRRPTRRAVCRATQLGIHPETGRFSFSRRRAAGGTLTQYHFGLMSTIGAGGFPSIAARKPGACRRP